VFYGEGINKEEVERAIELSTTKYCVISAMLKQSVKITHSYKIVKSVQTNIEEQLLPTTN